MLRNVASGVRLMLVVALAVPFILICPSVGEPVPFPPESTSGFLRMSSLGSGIGGAASVSTPAGDSLIISFLAPFTAPSSQGAFINWDQVHVWNTSASHGGQFGEEFCFAFPGGSPCPPHAFGFGDFVMRATPPPFTGQTQVTVPGTFSMTMGADVYSGPFPPTSDFLFSLGFQGSGPATLTFNWCPQCFAWEFQSGFADIHPTPEPATLFLFGTTAAGLGLTRWSRRRGRERAHAA
jgi:hypothetical protein